MTTDAGTQSTRHGAWLLAGVVLLVSALAWGWTVMGAGMDMTAVDMTRMAGMDGWLMQPAVWTPDYALLMFTMWWVMMIAMMLPSALPVLLVFAKAQGSADSRREQGLLTGSFATGYLLIWGLFSALAAGLQWSLETVRLLSPMLETANTWLGAAILIAAGLWQLTPIKAACLRHCRSPLGFLLGHWRAGNLGAMRMGLQHGAFCLGCCWFLMLLLFFGGVMNLYWIAGLTLYVLAEKLLPGGQMLGRVTGVALIAGGLALALL